ncbi:hypothetical protein AUP68_15200 [Ilyonectria robusta]
MVTSQSPPFIQSATPTSHKRRLSCSSPPPTDAAHRSSKKPKLSHPAFPPARFWDNLSEISLTRNALRELDRRNAETTRESPNRRNRSARRATVAKLEAGQPACQFLKNGNQRSSVTAAKTVTISDILNTSSHKYISKYLYYTILTDIGLTIGCNNPYENNYYYATAAASASIADNWISKCTSSIYSRGDLTLNLSSIQSIYRSYCIGAGFTQPGATDWYNPAEAIIESEPLSTGSSNSYSADA